MANATEVKKPAAPTLPQTAASELASYPITSDLAYRLTFSSVYVFLRRNEKFVSVKSEIDFFTPEEIKKLTPLESFFVSRIDDSTIEPIRANARHLRDVLKNIELSLTQNPEQAAPPPFQLSDWVLDQVSGVWKNAGKDGVIMDTRAVIFWVDTFCGKVTPKNWIACREQSVVDFKRRLEVSSWALFFALHLGYTSIPFLDMIRNLMFEPSNISGKTGYFEVDRLIELAQIWLTQSPGAITSDLIVSTRERKSAQRVADKLSFRLDRILRGSEVSHG